MIKKNRLPKIGGIYRDTEVGDEFVVKGYTWRYGVEASGKDSKRSIFIPPNIWNEPGRFVRVRKNKGGCNAVV